VTDPTERGVPQALAYHERTKHHLRRYARGPGHLDWDTQPDPFRTFAGAPTIELALLADSLATSYGDLYIPGAVAARPLEWDTVAVLFELALGLSAWKQFRGSRWALRCNPSSGNLHPTEGYALLPRLRDMEAGVYHYVSRDHILERRCALTDGAANRLSEHLHAGAFVIGLSSIHWREAWKYGERAFRYCQHDAGHALAAFRYAAAALGWSALLVDNCSDDDVAGLLGLDRDDDFASVQPADREYPDAALLVNTRGRLPAKLPDVSAELVQGGTWAGRANQLSRAHVDWHVLDEVARSTWKHTTERLAATGHSPLPVLPPGNRVAASALIRQRRSCLGLDGETSIGVDTFYAMLDHLLPRPGVPPWDALPWPPHIHLGVFVHRVRGLTPGLYFFERDAAVHDRLRPALRATFLWTRPESCPDHIHLFFLHRADHRDTSRQVSCHQEIASDGAFSLGMIADFGDTIRAHGAWWYRRLFWEAGVLGQVLYLEAEAAGVRGTGIGCYFDDAFHDLLGIKTDRFQDLYHFTCGGPAEDTRLQTHPPYAHLKR
jgi:SagB-type dehydrogenase family enzyme